MIGAIVGAAAVSGFGASWRGLAAAVRAGGFGPGPVADAVIDAAVPRRAHKTMSRGALLSTAAMHALVAEVAPGALVDAGCFVGVGASGGSVAELHAMLRASLDAGQWSLSRFGGAGLAACNPLLAFQLMNNFTMAHAAISHGVGGGTNSALFSRGGGTVSALALGLAAIDDGDCALAIVGGADSALHPVTSAELSRCYRPGIVGGEGAGYLIVGAADAPGALARIVSCTQHGGGLPGWPDAALVIVATAAPLAPPPGAAGLDVGAAIGECLAAGPALAWACAVDAVVTERIERVAVVTIDLDDEVGVVVLEAAT